MPEINIKPEIALGAKAPDSMTSLGNIMNIARGAQAYQQSAQAFPVELQRAQQAAEKERLINPELVTQAQETSKQQQFKTKQDYSQAMNQSLSALMQDPDIVAGTDPAAIARKIAHQRNALIRAGVPIEEAEIGASHLISAAQQNPASVVDLLGNVLRTNISAPQQQSNIYGTEQISGTTPTGQPRISVTSPSTGKVTFKAGEEAPTKTERPAAILPPTETAQSYQQLQEQRTSLANSAQDVNKGLARTDEIDEVIDSMIGGKLGDAAGKLSSMTGYIVPVGEEAAAARAIVKKDIAGLAIELNKATGGKFASSLESAAAALADPNAPFPAIKKSIEQIKPIMLHVKYMNNGLQKVIQSTNGDIRAERLFNNEMANAYDPKAILAIEANEKGKLADFLSKMSIEERKKIKLKAQKYENLMNGNL